MPPRKVTFRGKPESDDSSDNEDIDIVQKLETCISQIEEITNNCLKLRKELNELKAQIDGGRVSSVYSLHIEMGYGPGPSNMYTCQYCEDWWSNLARETQYHEKTCPSRTKTASRRAPAAPKAPKAGPSGASKAGTSGATTKAKAPTTRRVRSMAV